MKKKRWYPIISPKDEKVMQHIWRHKLATLQTIRQKFFSSESSKCVYDRLYKLWRAGYLVPVRLGGQQHRVWCLGKIGFRYLTESVLPELKEKRNMPHQLRHDAAVAEIIQGDWFKETPKSVQIITEQELKCLEFSFLPKKVEGGVNHDPDGLWVFENGKNRMTVALEVELNVKTQSRYEQVGSFYSSTSFFSHVVWAVTSIKHGADILKATKRYGIPREDYHFIVLLEQLKSILWQAPIRNGSVKGLTLAEFLNSMANGIDLKNINYPVARASQPPRTVVDFSENSPLVDYGFNLKKSAT